MDEDLTAGGSWALGELIDKYGDQLVADLQDEYGLDLRDLFIPGTGVTPSWVLLLIKGIGEDSNSRYIAERRGGQQFRGWTTDRYVSVATSNALRGLLYVVIRALGGKAPMPKPFKAPSASKGNANTPRKPGSFGFIAMSMLAQVKKRKAG